MTGAFTWGRRSWTAGLSVGVHLALATQKAASLIDAQVRANVNLRICLGTHDESDSFDVIEVGDAARIPVERPGRALVAHGGPVTFVQTARITTPTAGGSADVRRDVVCRNGRRNHGTVSGNMQRTDLDEIEDVVVAAARTEGLAPPYRLWTDPL